MLPFPPESRHRGPDLLGPPPPPTRGLDGPGFHGAETFFYARYLPRCRRSEWKIRSGSDLKN